MHTLKTAPPSGVPIRSTGGAASPAATRKAGTAAFYEEGRRCQDPGGRAGTLGEFTRMPAEAGSMYGVSVFADEYAAQQTQLARAARQTGAGQQLPG